jgi:hypothetical protein
MRFMAKAMSRSVFECKRREGNHWDRIDIHDFRVRNLQFRLQNDRKGMSTLDNIQKVYDEYDSPPSVPVC